MYQGVSFSVVFLAIGCCAPVMAQCTTCGNNYSTTVAQTYPSYPTEGQFVEGQPMSGQVIEGEIVQSYPADGQWIESSTGSSFNDGSMVSYDNSYPTEIPYESHPIMGTVSYPASVATQSYESPAYTSYPTQSYSTQGYSTQTYTAQSYPMQSYSTQGFENQSYSYQSAPVQMVSYNASASMGADRALSVVNRKRRRAGLAPLEMDPALTSVAQQKSANRANRRITGHDNLPRGGAAVEGVGYAHGHSDLCSQFNTCYLYSNGYRRAGAAIAYDNSGRAYYTLLLR